MVYGDRNHYSRKSTTSLLKAPSPEKDTHATNELIEYAKRLFPDLRVLSVANRHSYHKKMYEAILAARIYQEQQRIRKSQIERAQG